ncbi:MAG TPA: S8 family serine peptidase [Candidatus Acidoferrales bacterium]|nr:S8 family serine peptidase [Candidatus Acidoferrales bacterium]
MHIRAALSISFAVAVAACSAQNAGTLPVSPASGGTQSASVAMLRQRPLLPPNVERACPDEIPSAARCFALVRTDVLGARTGAYHGADLRRAAAGAAAKFSGYEPADLQSAYALPSTTAGNGQTVGIVDAYGDPTAESDLAVYRKQFGLPACTTKNHCLRILNEKGQPKPLPPSDPQTNWTFEESLDLDMVSAACPNCKIVFVETDNNDWTNLHPGVKAAVGAGASVVSNSYGGSEYEPSDADYTYPGKAVITASAGDYYLDPEQPASLSTVVAVGGTQLVKASNKRGWSEVVWNDSYDKYYLATASGCSNYVTKPSWQKDKGCATRANNDVAASADCIYYVKIYDSQPYNGKKLGWTGACGTSVASPLVAGMYGLAGNAKAVSSTYAKSIYDAAGTPALNPIVKGSNWEGGACPKAILYICTAGPGYNGPGGWGSPNGVSAL